MKVTLEMYGREYSMQCEHEDLAVGDVQHLFDCLLVCAGYPESILEKYKGDEV